VKSVLPDKEHQYAALAACDFADQLRRRRNDGAHTAPTYEFEDREEAEEFLVSSNAPSRRAGRVRQGRCRSRMGDRAFLVRAKETLTEPETRPAGAISRTGQHGGLGSGASGRARHGRGTKHDARDTDPPGPKVTGARSRGV
jgi:hypothetical protein